MVKSKIDRARKKVKALKNWYLFIAIATVGTVFMIWMSFYIKTQGAPEYVSWIFRLIPVVWWGIAFLQWLNLRDKLPRPIEVWEERQIKKIMDEDSMEIQKYK